MSLLLDKIGQVDGIFVDGARPALAAIDAGGTTIFRIRPNYHRFSGNGHRKTEKIFTVRAAGVINMGQTRPLRATWKSDSIRTLPD